MHVPANPSLAPLQFNVRRNPEVAELRDALPAVPFTLADLKESELAEGLKAFTRGKFTESLAAFRTVLQKAMLVAVQTDAEAVEVSLAPVNGIFQVLMQVVYSIQVQDIVALCKEYVVGLRLETERQRLVAEEPDNAVRHLELAAYFTHCNLQPAHIQLALRSAMRVFAKAGNHATAAVFARRLIDMKPTDSKVVSTVSRDYEPNESQVLTLTPLSSGSFRSYSGRPQSP